MVSHLKQQRCHILNLGRLRIALRIGRNPRRWIWAITCRDWRFGTAGFGYGLLSWMRFGYDRTAEQKRLDREHSNLPHAPLRWDTPRVARARPRKSQEFHGNASSYRN